MDATWGQDEEIERYAYVERKHRRFAGRWQPEGPGDDTPSMFGTLFMSYKGQFFYYFIIELVIIALQGIAIGAMPSVPVAQASLILALESLSFVLAVWLAPFNDVAENLLNMIIGALNVAISGIQVRQSETFLKDVAEYSRAYPFDLFCFA
mmetsp:Transcript_44739/g.173577  ORF Transcript_44739/g.173577 Transcript_44739/m.173577 type:complete len:151 (-) Transcript_44739:1262-1714(-)